MKQDIRFALAGWRRSPAFAAVAILTLALGIGANTAIFSVVSGVLLRPLPFRQPENLVRIFETQPRDQKQGGFDGPVVWSDLEEWRTSSKLTDGMVTYSPASRNLQGQGDAEQVAIVSTERGLFSLLGVPAYAGRTFVEGDALNVVVASHRFWTAHFGEAKFSMGQSITLDGQSYTILGVMPALFQFPHGAASTDLWVPNDTRAAFQRRPNGRVDSVLARLKPGVSPEAAQQELAGMQSTSQGRRLVRIERLHDVVSGPVKDSLLILLGAVGMVLLATCVNVANLMLVRVASRGKEVAIRAALGAGRWRLMRQFLTESLMLALAGGVAGLAIGVWGSRLLTRFASAQIPRADEIGLDWRVFTFSLVACLATGIGFGLFPAISAARSAGREIKGTRLVFRDALVVVQIGLAFILLAGAGLLVRTFLNLQATNPGLVAENVLTAHISVTGAPESLAIEQRVAQIPGVRSVGSISLLPLQYSDWGAFFTINGRTELLSAQLRYVTPNYFEAMRIPLRRGRSFMTTDIANTPMVIVVNETLANRYFPNQDPVGRVTNRGTIIGVVGDTRQQSLSLPAVPEIFYTITQNFAQLRSHGSTLVVRASGPVEPLAGMIRAAVKEVSPGQALFRMATMQEVIRTSLAVPRLYAWLLGLFALMGVLLAVAGIYGVIAYLVTVRTREFGIRLALGADAPRLIRLVLSRGAILVAIGLVLGIAGASALTTVLQGALYGVKPTDPITFAAMAALMALVAITACLIPARRAASVDPVIALRAD